MKEMQRQKDDFRYLLPPMVNDHESLDCFSRAGYVIYQVAGCMALLRRSRVCGHWLELPLKGPKAEAAGCGRSYQYGASINSARDSSLYCTPHRTRRERARARAAVAAAACEAEMARIRSPARPTTRCRCLGS